MSRKTPIFFISGDKFPLQNGGLGACAVPFNTGFVTVGGGAGSGFHGKVNRCSYIQKARDAGDISPPVFWIFR